MTSALARGDDAAAIDLPRDVWARGERPLRGRVFRWTLAATVASLALVVPVLWGKILVLMAAGVVFWAVRHLADTRLERLAQGLEGVGEAEAGTRLVDLENRRWIALLAPHAWISAQKGRLHLKKGDPRAAAHAFAEAARQVGNVQQPHLAGAQAHALMLSGDRKQARDLLVGLEDRKELRALDRFNLGVVYVEERGKTDRAVRLLEAAREGLGPAPRLTAALALAYARSHNLERAQSCLAELADDAFARDDAGRALLRRAKRSIRQGRDEQSQGRRKKRNSPEAQRPPGDVPLPKSRSTAANDRREDRRKDRRKDRREKRKARKASPTARASVAKGSGTETSPQPALVLPPVPPPVRPPRLAAPTVAGPTASGRSPAITPAIDTDGWDDLLE